MVAVGLAVIACAPRLSTLSGAPVTRSLPRTALADGHTRMVFRWELEEPDLSARGEGAARLASPDSARMDFFIAGGLGSGAAVLIGGELRLPPRGDDIARRLVPPPPLLWTSLGRLALPALKDTVVRVDGDTLRADIGNPVAWRVTFARDTLRRAERVEGGRVVEWVTRSADGHVQYRHEASRRRLDLYITRSDNVGAFDPFIWDFR